MNPSPKPPAQPTAAAVAVSSRWKRRYLRLIASRHRLRILLALTIGLLILLQLVAFSPTRLERELPPQTLTEDKILEQVIETTHSSEAMPKVEIPKGEVPEYSVDGFQFVSIEAGVKQWRIEAEHAFFYKTSGFVHATGVRAQIFDQRGDITRVTAEEAKFNQTTSELQLFTNVKAIFPEGLQTLSPFMEYTGANREVQVPLQVPIEGLNPGTKDQEELAFYSYGMTFRQETNIVNLHSRVRVEVRRTLPDKSREITVLESDKGMLDRGKGLALFTMNDLPDGQIGVVTINQPDMECKSRRAEVRFGGARQLRTLRAIEDVKIREIPRKDPTYATNPRARAPVARRATAGIAEFDSLRNVIVLKEYPQVYQDHDTITGDVIIVHRGSDLVEVEQSNAFSEGNDGNEN